MAQGFAGFYGNEKFRAFSAGSRPAGFVAPLAIEVMKEKGIDISGHYSKSVGNLTEKEFDVVVTMGCGDTCPWVPAKKRVEWKIEDPIGGSVEVFRRVRDEIEGKVRELFQNEVYPSLSP